MAQHADKNDDADDDQDSAPSASLEVRASTLGNVNISLYGGSPGVLAVIPGALNCAWMRWAG